MQQIIINRIRRDDSFYGYVYEYETFLSSRVILDPDNIEVFKAADKEEQMNKTLAGRLIDKLQYDLDVALQNEPIIVEDVDRDFLRTLSDLSDLAWINLYRLKTHGDFSSEERYFFEQLKLLCDNVQMDMRIKEQNLKMVKDENC